MFGAGWWRFFSRHGLEDPGVLVTPPLQHKAPKCTLRGGEHVGEESRTLMTQTEVARHLGLHPTCQT